MSFQEQFDSDNEYADDNIEEFDVQEESDPKIEDSTKTEGIKHTKPQDDYKLTVAAENEPLIQLEETPEPVEVENKTPIESSISAVENTSNEEKDAFDFKAFLEYLKDPRVEPILKYTRSFISQILKSERFYDLKEQQKLITDFEIFIHKKFNSYEPFKSMDEDNLNNSKDCMEKLLTNKLYVKLFSPLYYKNFKKYCAIKEVSDVTFPEDHKAIINNDKLIWDNIMKFGSIITLENLETEGITEENTALLSKFLKVFDRELFRMGKFRSPRDKLVCLLNSCKIIFSFLKKKTGNTSSTADDFMPLLIYAILKISDKVDTENYWLLSSMTYIETFRQAEFLKGEESYYLMSFQGALQFILELDEKNIFTKMKIKDEGEFQKLLDERNGFLVAKEIKKEEQHKKKLEVNKKKEEQANVEDDGLLSSLMSGNWFGTKQGPETPKTDTTPKQNDLKRQILEQEKQDVEYLKEMFPQFEEAILKDVYYSKEKNIPLTIETLLEFL